MNKPTLEAQAYFDKNFDAAVEGLTEFYRRLTYPKVLAAVKIAVAARPDAFQNSGNALVDYEKIRDAIESVVDGIDVSLDFVIPAEVHSDDRVHEISFDALAWFETASDGEIAVLIECGWHGDYPADVVAQHAQPTNPEIDAMFNYLHSIADIPSKKDQSGYECSVDSECAIDWIVANRPVVAEIYAGQDGWPDAVETSPEAPGPGEIAATHASDTFESDFQLSKAENAKLIEWLSAEVGGTDLSEFFDEVLDELKAYLGAEAANQCEEAGDQEAAISFAENFVAEHVCNSTENMVALTIWSNGPETGTSRVREALSAQTPAPGMSA